METWRDQVKHLKLDCGWACLSFLTTSSFSWYNGVREISLPEWSWSKRWGSLSSPVLLLGLTGKAPVSWHFLFPLVSQLICFYSLSRPGFQANETHGMLYTKPLLSPTWWLRFCSLTVTVRSAGHSTAGWLSGTHHAFMTSQLLHEGDILCTAANRLWGEDLKSRPRWLYSLIFMHSLLSNISFHPQFLYLRNAHTCNQTLILTHTHTHPHTQTHRLYQRPLKFGHLVDAGPLILPD